MPTPTRPRRRAALAALAATVALTSTLGAQRRTGAVLEPVDDPSFPAEVTPTTSTTAPVAPGKYRVTITGFKVRQETYDNPLEYDGKRDEVFVTAVVRLVDPAGNAVAPPVSLITPTYGDRNGYPSRIPAGSASAAGGLRTGDSYLPASGTPFRDRLPLVAYEGPLAKGGNTSVIVPVVWEVDNVPSIIDNWRRAMSEPAWSQVDKALVASTAAAIGPAGLFTADGKAVNTPESAKYQPLKSFGIGSSSAGRLFVQIIDVLSPIARHVTGVHLLFGMAERGVDRPIGLDANNAFNPRAIPLNFDLAELAVARGSDGTPGVIEVPFDDHDALKGKYTLYLRVQRIP